VAQRGKVELTAAQRRALLVLASERGASLTRTEYARLTGLARSQASCDLSELVSAGLVVRVGRGRSTRYELAHEPAVQQVWTPDRTRRELEANELGLSDRAANAARGPRSRLVWALVGVAALAALAAAARGLPLVATHGFGSAIRAITGAAAPVKPPLARARRPAPTVAATHASVRAPKSERITRSAAEPAVKPAPPVQQTPAQQRTDVSNVAQTVPVHTTPPPNETSSAAATAPESGPAPLPAPAGPSPPSPLKAP
jgi:DNA-binding transcriptional ArsR family regulator